MNISLEDAARGAPEMSYWPIFATSIIYVNYQNYANLLIVLISILTGSVMYLSIKRLSSQITKSKKILFQKSAAGRGAKSKNYDYAMEELRQFNDAIFPNSKIKKSFFVSAIFANLLIGIYGYVFVIELVMLSSNINLLYLFLLILPILYGCNLIIYFWAYS